MIATLIFGGGLFIIGMILLFLAFVNFFRFIKAVIGGTIFWLLWNYALVAAIPSAKSLSWWSVVVVTFILLFVISFLFPRGSVTVRSGSSSGSGG